ncbi:MAG: GxxExxY protein [Patescibacteria group bacterium]|mgnify:CR=1 FL=1
MPRIIQKELSYKIMGILFSVHNELGNRYQEKYYQRAIEEGLKQEKLNFKKELSVDLLYNGKKIGKYFLDFLIEDKVILEVKTVDRLKPKDFKQVLAYLAANNLELGILVNFRTDRLSYKRILNSKTIRKDSE